jgi:hypothetical protein
LRSINVTPVSWKSSFKNKTMLKHHQTLICLIFVNLCTGFVKLAAERDPWMRWIGKSIDDMTIYSKVAKKWDKMEDVI